MNVTSTLVLIELDQLDHPHLPVSSFRRFGRVPDLAPPS